MLIDAHCLTAERSSHALHIYGVLAMNDFQRIFFIYRVVSLLVLGFYRHLRMAMILECSFTR